MKVCRLDLLSVSVSRPTRFHVAQVYFKRAVRWRRNSHPFISGDAFADIADYVYKPPRWRNFNKDRSICDAEVIFCRSHELQEMLDMYSEILTAKVLIASNSDFEFRELPQNIPTSVKALFLQNSFISDNVFVFTIPIGIENFRLGVNGNPQYVRFRPQIEERQHRVLFGPLGLTHPLRKEVIKTFGSLRSEWNLLNARISPREYDLYASKYAYIAAVRGNGVDTHRLWESLYRGLTPIVGTDDWWDSLSGLYPQVISVAEWQPHEIMNVVLSQVQQNFNPREIVALWMPYWEKRISDLLVR